MTASAAKTNSHGMDKEIWKKLDGKFDPDRAKNALAWVLEVTGETYDLKPDGKFSDQFGAALKDGYLVAKLAKKIDSGIVKKLGKKKWVPKHTTQPFKARENIELFGKACMIYGMKNTDVCTSQDLYNLENLNNVVNTLYSLSAQAQKLSTFNGPYIADGFSHSTENKRVFSQEVLNAGKNAIPMLNQGSVKVDTSGRLDSAGIVKTAGNEDWVADTTSTTFTSMGSIAHKSKKLDATNRNTTY